MNGRFGRFVVKRRGTARKPGCLSYIGLVIWSSSCNDGALEKRLTFLGVIDRSKSGLFGCAQTWVHNKSEIEVSTRHIRCMT